MTHYPLGVFFLASALTRRLYSACHAKNDGVIISLALFDHHEK
jgi:hypothetical protein